MEELLSQAFKGLIAAGPFGAACILVIKYLVNKVDELTKENKQLAIDRENTNKQVIVGKNECMIELLKAKDMHNVDKMQLYERVMRIFNHLGDGDKEKT